MYSFPFSFDTSFLIRTVILLWVSDLFKSVVGLSSSDTERGCHKVNSAEDDHEHFVATKRCLDASNRSYRGKVLIWYWNAVYDLYDLYHFEIGCEAVKKYLSFVFILFQKENHSHSVRYECLQMILIILHRLKSTLEFCSKPHSSFSEQELAEIKLFMVHSIRQVEKECISIFLDFFFSDCVSL